MANFDVNIFSDIEDSDEDLQDYVYFHTLYILYHKILACI